MRNLPERDWKIFREIYQSALNRFCQETLDHLPQISQDQALTPHERYLAVYKYIEKRDREIDQVFDGLRRSTAYLLLLVFYRRGLVSTEDMARLTPETHAAITSVEF